MAKPVILSNGRVWKTQKAALDHFREMLARHHDDEQVNDRGDHNDLVALLERHDEAITDGPPKTGTGIDSFFRRRNVFEGFSTPSFWVRRVDGTETDFSYIHAVKGSPKGRSQQFSDACRAAIRADLLAAKRTAFVTHGDARGAMPCELTGVSVTFENAHLDHAWPTFAMIVASFRAARGWSHAIPDDVLSAPADGQTETVFVDASVADDFKRMHHSLAILRIVAAKPNMQNAASQRRPRVKNPIQMPASSS